MAHDKFSNKSLGEVVREARIVCDWSLRDLAKKLAKTPSYLSDIENDRRIPAEEMLRELAQLLALDFDDLMARAGRFGEDTVRYVTRVPAAGALFRRMTAHNFNHEQVQQLAKFTEQLASKDKSRK